MSVNEAKRPLCFVLMPFGKKENKTGRAIDFDDVYAKLISPAARAAGLEPIRADEEKTGGIIHKPMLERLVLCEYAVADLTLANANVYYELGIRHAIRPWTTILLFAEGTRLPFDVEPLRAVPYHLSEAGRPTKPDRDKAKIQERLVAARDRSPDSPLFQLLDGYSPPDISRLKTDVFRRQVEYSARTKEKLDTARREGVSAIKAVEQSLGELADVEAGILVDLLLSYRAVEAWPEMIRLAEGMPPPVAETVMVREQLAFALNRAGQKERAEQVLRRVIEKYGPSSETYGILGRVYKDRWEAARDAGDNALAHGLLEKATETYLKGFEADWRDAYPGINAVTLMELHDPPDERLADLLPVVMYSAKQRVEKGTFDYWDCATLLELNVLKRDRSGAQSTLTKALPIVREVWEPRTTLRNLKLIRGTRHERGEDVAWLLEIEHSLEQAVARFSD